MASMATTTTTIPAHCSSLRNTKVSTITKPKQPFTISTATLVPKHRSFKPISLKTPLFPSLSLLRFRLSSASFDGVELKDESFSSEEQDPETEQEEEKKVLTSNNDGGDDSGRVYVGNLPYSMNSSELARIFAEAGSVVTVEVIYDKVKDRSRGFAFVTMASVEEAQEAIRLFDGSQIEDRTVKVNFPQVPRGGEREVMGPKMRDMNKGYVDSPHKIYAGNLSWRLTSADLREAFANQPGILSAKVIYERDTGRSRGFGFVTFETPESALAALDSMNGVEVGDRPLRLNMALNRASEPSSSASENATEGADSDELVASVST